MPLNTLSDHFGRLPGPLVLEISDYLSGRDLLSLVWTANFFRQNEDLWKKLFERYYGEEYDGYAKQRLLNSFVSYQAIFRFLSILNIQEKEIGRLKDINTNHNYSKQVQIIIDNIKSKYGFLYTCQNASDRLSWFNERNKEIELCNAHNYNTFKDLTYVPGLKHHPYDYNIFMQNIFSRLPRSVLEAWNGSNGRIRSLILSSNELTTLPDALFTIPGLKRLVLTDNTIRELPASIAQATSLTSLSIGNNRLTALPDALFTLTHLNYLLLGNERLNGYRNQLTGLPATIGQLTCLMGLDVRNLGLQSLPSDLTRLKHLQYIAWDGNNLSVDSLSLLPSWQNRADKVVLDNIFTPAYCEKGFLVLDTLDKQPKNNKRRCIIS